MGTRKAGGTPAVRARGLRPISLLRFLLALGLLSVSSVACAAESAPAAVPNSAPYTLDQVLAGLRQRAEKYSSLPLRIEYRRTVNNAQNEPPQKTECALVTQWGTYREEVRDAKGRAGFHQRVGSLRVEVGRHWQGFELVLPYNGVEAKDLGERINYYAHDVSLPPDNNILLLVQGPSLWTIEHLRGVEKAGRLTISRTNLNGLACVEVSAIGIRLRFAPELDWAIVQEDDLAATDFRKFGDLRFPTKLTCVSHLHDLQGGFFTYEETCEIQNVTKAESLPADLWKVPEPKPGTWVKVAYPKWSPDLEQAGVTKEKVRDTVRFEHAFEWKKPLPEKEASIYEVSRHWRDTSKLNLALDSTGAHMEGYQAPLPFLARDGARNGSGAW
jgi:hypothetical protein